MNVISSPEQEWKILKADLDASPDLEQKIEAIRLFTHRRQKEIESKDASGSMTLEELFRSLSNLAEGVFRGAFDVATQDLLARFTPPRGPFAVVAMGKFGAGEITYRSDLDLIYLYEEPQDQEFYARLATRIISVLTLLTRNGYAYKIDVGLRPSGNAGALVASLTSFCEYHQNEAQVWEKQALIKARSLPMTGNDTFIKKLEEEFTRITFRPCSLPSDSSAIATEISRLRKRMEFEIAREKPGLINLKTGRGGIVDIEFSVQFLQLIHGFDCPSLRVRGTLEALTSLSRERILPEKMAQELSEAYLFLRRIETRLRQVLDQSTDELRETSPCVKVIEEKYLGFSLLPALKKTRERVRILYEEVLKNDPPSL